MKRTSRYLLPPVGTAVVAATLVLATATGDLSAAASANGQPTQLEKVRTYCRAHPALCRYRQDIQQFLRYFQNDNALQTERQQVSRQASQQQESQEMQRAQDQSQSRMRQQLLAAQKRQACIAGCQTTNVCNGQPTFSQTQNCPADGAMCRAQCR